MKKFVLFATIAVVGFIASCGGSGGGTPTPTPTPTSDATKALTVSSRQASMDASLTGMEAAFATFAPKATVVKVAKAIYEGSGTATHTCRNGGTVDASATGTGDCTETASGYSCTNLIFDVNLTFHDCAANATIGGTEYAEVLNGPGSSRFTGSVSGPTDSLPTAGTFTGALAGTLTATGTAAGTVNLDDLDVAATLAEGVEPAVTCTGTASVTIDSTTQVCAISTDCSTCTE